MCFHRNINGNRDVKFLECDYACAMVCETHFTTKILLELAGPLFKGDEGDKSWHFF